MESRQQKLEAAGYTVSTTGYIVSKTGYTVFTTGRQIAGRPLPSGLGCLFLLHIGFQVQGLVVPIFRLGLPTSINITKIIILCRHGQRPESTE